MPIPRLHRGGLLLPATLLAAALVSSLDAASLRWTGKDLRRVHVLLVSPPWAKDRLVNFEPGKVVRELRATGVGTIELYLKDHHGISYNHTKYGNNYGGPDILQPFLRATREAGLKFIAYYSVGRDQWAWDRFPEWRNPGEVRLSGPTWNRINIRSGYRDFALDQIEEIAAQPVDGFFFDIFETADEEFLKNAVSRIKKLRPAAEITFNGAGTHRAALNRWVDFSSAEAHAPDFIRQSCTARLLRRESKPFTIETPGHTLGWAGWAVKPAPAMMLEAAIAMAHGGAAVMGLNPYPNGAFSRGALDALGRLYQWIGTRESFCLQSAPVSDVAVLTAYRSDLRGDFRLPVEALHTALLDGHVQFSFVNEDAVLDSYPLVIASERFTWTEETRTSLRRYVSGGGKLIVMNTALHGLEDVLGIRQQDGGTPVSFSYAELKTPALKKELADEPVLIRGVPVRVVSSGAEVLATTVLAEAEITPTTFVGWSRTNPPAVQTNEPMILRHRFGRGEALYIAAPLATDLSPTASALKQLLRNMIDLLLPEAAVKTNAAPGVEVVLNRQADRYVLHLINTNSASAGRYVFHEAQVMKASGVAVQFNKRRMGGISKVVMQPEGRVLEVRDRGAYLHVRIPDFAVHTMLVLQ